MSTHYRAVLWNRQKRIYDLTLAGSVAAFLIVFIGTTGALFPDVTAETLLIRGFAATALVLLHVILWIGPLCRLDPRFLPLLYNRRHLGVTMFLFALAHGGFSVIQFHALGDTHPLVSVLVSNPRIDELAQFPFQPFGLFALGILFVMAATSHDFWLANLTAPFWKALHMGVYLAYALIVAHVMLGVVQSELHPAYPTLMGAGIVSVLALHLTAGLRERGRDIEQEGDVPDGFVDVCSTDDIPDRRAIIVTLSGERVAVFRNGNLIHAISNVCQHQNGPLGEGEIIDGCVTCPWHGYQYDPANGRSPAPFTERIPTFDVRVVDGRVHVFPSPHPPGTPVEPAQIGDSRD